ncbi:Uncharacterized protein FWK35_00003087 [Aphis craccivora]|uniref:Uncharacterized protein n=1 Tax=Aphis craccivora TaxID=307492 RepID=A0A6G0Z608_APHCR|nr:Uncharacterized protein FWK35_00003087 [Aphis craccivora]
MYSLFGVQRTRRRLHRQKPFAVRNNNKSRSVGDEKEETSKGEASMTSFRGGETSAAAVSRATTAARRRHRLRATPTSRGDGYGTSGVVHLPPPIKDRESDSSHRATVGSAVRASPPPSSSLQRLRKLQSNVRVTGRPNFESPPVARFQQFA